MSFNAFEYGEARCAGADQVRTARQVRDGHFAVAAAVAEEFPVLDWTPALEVRYAQAEAAVAPTSEPYLYHGVKIDLAEI